MAEKTDLNVAPYYDDFDTSDNFVKTLFRPGFAIQARELTQLQSALQNQISQHGSHIFKEGAQVIPGAVSFNRRYFSLKLASTFAGETIDPSQYYSATTPVTLTGATTGVTATVIGYDVATTTDQPTLYLRYLSTGSDNEEKSFRDGENLSANYGVTHTTAYSSGAASATTYISAYSAVGGATLAQLVGSTGPAAATGSSVTVQAGVYYIRGQFVECSEETLVLDKYNNSPSYRVGFTVTETLVTPEDDSTLLDNATGSTNYAAKGAHRLKFTLALAKIARDSTADSNFIQLLDTKSGILLSKVDRTEYEILEETMARRTFDESGDYTVRPFQVTMKESTTLNERIGVYEAGKYTDGGKVSTNDLLAIQVSTGKNNKPKVLQCAEILKGSMSLAASVQSLDKEVLLKIKRDNISEEQLLDMTKAGNKISANTYSEVILALPGDSKQKHMETVLKLADADMNLISTYQCMILEGSELGSKNSRDVWKLSLIHI